MRRAVRGFYDFWPRERQKSGEGWSGEESPLSSPTFQIVGIAKASAEPKNNSNDCYQT